MLAHAERPLLSRGVRATSRSPVPGEAERDGQSEERIHSQRRHAAAGTPAIAGRAKSPRLKMETV